MKRLQKIQGKERVSFSLPFVFKKSLFILAIFCFLSFSSGCTDINGSSNKSELVEVIKDANSSNNKTELVEVTNLNQIDEALNKGPVVLKLGSKECIPCKEQEQVLSELLPTYQDSASIMLIDVNKYDDFATTFGVVSIPDTCVIVGKEDGKYIYMRPDGSKSLDRATARFLGVTDKETLSETLEKAIALRKTEA
ncbi:MAG TPA: thioredoxin family protein [Ignavibacteria bacterium]